MWGERERERERETDTETETETDTQRETMGSEVRSMTQYDQHFPSLGVFVRATRRVAAWRDNSI